MQHLTEEEIAICSEAINAGDYRSLPAELRKHLSHCDECATEVLMVAEIAGEFDFSIKPEKNFREKTQRIIAWSVSIAAAIALVLLVVDQEINPFNHDRYLSQNSTTEQTIQNTGSTPQTFEKTEQQTTNQLPKAPDKQQEKDQAVSSYPTSSAPGSHAPSTTPEIKPDTLKFLAHYAPDETLEKLATRFEGNLRDNGDITIETPVAVVQKENSVVVKWQNPEKKKLIIEVFNNSGQRLLEAETIEEEYTLSDLKKGLYYWKLISGSDFELLFCGKISIE